MSTDRLYFWIDSKVVATEREVTDLRAWIGLPCVDPKFAPSKSRYYDLYTGKFILGGGNSNPVWEYIHPDKLPRLFLAAMKLRGLYEQRS